MPAYVTTPEGGAIPEYASRQAAAADLTTSEDATVQPGELGLLETGVVTMYNEGWVLLVSLRSSTPQKWGLLCPHGIGIIDRDYCGPEDTIKIQVYNFTSRPVTVPAGTRIAQAIWVSSSQMKIERAPLNPNSSRGGFGSTG